MLTSSSGFPGSSLGHTGSAGAGICLCCRPLRPYLVFLDLVVLDNVFMLRFRLMNVGSVTPFVYSNYFSLFKS